jgi:hypothetical protein
MSQPEEIKESIPAPRGSGRGGKRPGSGRPRLGKFRPLPGDREYAKDLLSTLMRDESQEPVLRVRCAVVVLMKGDFAKYRPDASAGPAADPPAPNSAHRGISSSEGG